MVIYFPPSTQKTFDAIHNIGQFIKFQHCNPSLRVKLLIFFIPSSTNSRIWFTSNRILSKNFSKLNIMTKIISFLINFTTKSVTSTTGSSSAFTHRMLLSSFAFFFLEPGPLVTASWILEISNKCVNLKGFPSLLASTISPLKYR